MAKSCSYRVLDKSFEIDEKKKIAAKDFPDLNQNAKTQLMLFLMHEQTYNNVSIYQVILFGINSIF